MGWFRILQLIKGVGPVMAQRAFQHVAINGYRPVSLTSLPNIGSASEGLNDLVTLMHDLEEMGTANPGAQIERIARFYIPLLERHYEDPAPRSADIEHLGQIASRYDTRQQFLTEIVLDPPSSTGDLAGPPIKDEDWLVLSTIHSAKGLEWDAVYLIHASDGNLPADMATGTEGEIEEELRLAYVAMTRARDFLYVLWPLRYYTRPFGASDNHSFAPCCRFFTTDVTATMSCLTTPWKAEEKDSLAPDAVRTSFHNRLNQMWD
jgi:DNA helicase II / ATP-dependent DNA helicase PcrA